MKKGSSLLLASVLLLAALAGCSTGEDNSLVSKTPFPEFSEADTEGNPVSSDIFADYDATIVNFWNNGCGSPTAAQNGRPLSCRSWRSCITSFRSGTSISSA